MVFPKVIMQGSAHLANVSAGAFSTWGAIHNYHPAFCWVFGVRYVAPVAGS